MKSGSEKLLDQSRKERSTACFYDESYWDEYWKGRFSGDEKEAIKRVTYIRETIGMTRFLDAGCGLGYVVMVARKEGYDALGMDISPAALKRAPDEIKKFLRHGTIVSLPFGDRSFGLVTCFDIFEHLYIEQIFQAIKEVCRVAGNWVLVRSPIIGWKGEQCVADHSHVDIDRSHVSVYPWDFWARQFSQVGGFRFHKANIFYDEDYDGLTADAWMVFKRKKGAPE